MSNEAPVEAAATATNSGNSALYDMLNDLVDQQVNITRNRIEERFEESTKVLKAQIDQRFIQAYNDIGKILQDNYLLSLKGGENLFNRLHEPFRQLEGALCTLIEQDPFAHEYMRMKFEIIELKKMIGIREFSILPYLH